MSFTHLAHNASLFLNGSEILISLRWVSQEFCELDVLRTRIVFVVHTLVVLILGYDGSERFTAYTE